MWYTVAVVGGSMLWQRNSRAETTCHITCALCRSAEVMWLNSLYSRTCPHLSVPRIRNPDVHRAHKRCTGWCGWAEVRFFLRHGFRYWRAHPCIITPSGVLCTYCICTRPNTYYFQYSVQPDSWRTTNVFCDVISGMIHYNTRSVHEAKTNNVWMQAWKGLECPLHCAGISLIRGSVYE